MAMAAAAAEVKAPATCAICLEPVDTADDAGGWAKLCVNGHLAHVVCVRRSSAAAPSGPQCVACETRTGEAVTLPHDAGALVAVMRIDAGTDVRLSEWLTSMRERVAAHDAQDYARGTKVRGVHAERTLDPASDVDSVTSSSSSAASATAAAAAGADAHEPAAPAVDVRGLVMAHAPVEVLRGANVGFTALARASITLDDLIASKYTAAELGARGLGLGLEQLVHLGLTPDALSTYRSTPPGYTAERAARTPAGAGADDMLGALSADELARCFGITGEGLFEAVCGRDVDTLLGVGYTACDLWILRVSLSDLVAWGMSRAQFVKLLHPSLAEAINHLRATPQSVRALNLSPADVDALKWDREALAAFMKHRTATEGGARGGFALRY